WPRWGLGQAMLLMRPLGCAALRGLRHRVGVRALLFGVGILGLATTQGWAASRDLPEAGAAWHAATPQVSRQDNPLGAPATPQLGLLRLASKAHAPQAALPPPPSQPKPQPQQAAKPPS